MTKPTLLRFLFAASLTVLPSLPATPIDRPTTTAVAILQLEPAMEGDSVVKGRLTCSRDSSACSEVIRLGTLCIYKDDSPQQTATACTARSFTAAPDSAGIWQLRFSGEALRVGDIVSLRYGNGLMSNTVHAFPSPSDVAVFNNCAHKTVSVYFRGQAQVELRLLKGKALKRLPWKSAVSSDGMATFNTDSPAEEDDQFEAVATMGQERHTYPAVAAACAPDAQSELADARSVTPKTVRNNQPNPAEPPSFDLTPPAETSPDPPTLTEAKEGDTLLGGYAKGFPKVLIEITAGRKRSEKDDDPPAVVLKREVDVNSSSGEFTCRLAQPLVAGQQITVTGISAAGSPQSAPKTVDAQDKVKRDTSKAISGNARLENAVLRSSAANGAFALAGGTAIKPKNYTVASVDLDWGRVRGYFTLGLVLSQRANDFSVNNASPFLDYTMDKNWLAGKRSSNQWGDIRFNTFFDSRLTAIPTTAVASAPAAATPQTLTANSVLLSRQAASLQVGVYLPVVLQKWYYKNIDYSLSVAPLAKTGFYTLTDTGGVSNPANTSIANSANGARFYSFYSFGARIGHFEDYYEKDNLPSRKRASELLSHLDILVGRYGNFEYVNAGCSAATSACIRERQWRYSFEGMLKIPHTPLIFGMSANLAAQRSHAKGMLAPPDDLRFLFGAKFDAPKLVRSMFTPGN